MFFVGVDVGTSSARAALVDSKGAIIHTSSSPIRIWNPSSVIFEQSSEDIWSTCVRVIKDVTRDVPAESVKGLGFDATCSLVALDKSGNPLTVSTTGENERNIIMWLDHRAGIEANAINSTKHPLLRFVGGKVSLEMEMPKLLWLKKNLADKCWKKAGYFFDLPDFLTWKATGSNSRSLCSLVCKWCYEIKSEDSHCWNEGFMSQIGLIDLLDDSCRKIGNEVLMPGSPIDGGLSKEAAEELGLLQGTPVGASIIDAHAGGLGMIGCSAPEASKDFCSRLGLICGTSTCHMMINQHPKFVQGVWGPYFSAMVPEYWLNEGGQSATGKLLDFVTDSHPASPKIRAKNGEEKHIQLHLNDILYEMSRGENPARLTNNLHVWPDFHGNRSPLADPNLRGMFSGLGLANNEQSLALPYLSTVQSLAYGTRQIIESLKRGGHQDVAVILICGGLSKNPLFVQTHADVVGVPVLCPNETESVLLGSAILGACAAGIFPNASKAALAMGGTGRLVLPDAGVKAYHDRKYRVFLKMVEDQITYAEIMNSEEG